MNDTIGIRHILVPTDFSDHATAATRFAALLARRFGARVTLLHASGADLPSMAGLHGAPVDAAQTQARTLRALEGMLSAHLGDVDTLVRTMPGAPADAILAASRIDATDLIVMGTRGRGGLHRALLGSVAEEVIRDSERPVLTVRRSRPAVMPRVERILCPINYTVAATKAFRQALLFASAFEAELVALYLEEHGWGDIENEVERLREWVGDVPMSVRLTCLARRGDAATQLNDHARTHGADLVVAGAQLRHDGLETVIGSTTDQLTRHAPCPVLTVPAGTIMLSQTREEETVGWGA